MNVLDVLILAVGAAAATAGYRLGFVARATSWLGMAVGLVVAARLLPRAIEAMGDAGEAQLLLVAAGMLLGGAFIGQGIGLMAGSRLRVAIPPGGAQVLDRAAGATAGALGVAVVVWLLLPAMADIPDWPAQQARSSLVTRTIDSVFPEPPDTLLALRRLVGEDRFPQVFDALRPAPSVGSVPGETGISPQVTDRVIESIVQVSGSACGRLQEGSGVVLAPGLVATNAHVVAGQEASTVIRSDGRELDAQVVVFDPARDLALLRVADLDRPALPLGTTESGGRGGVFGFPEGGPLEISPFEVDREVTATGTDIYDDARTRRQVYFLAADLDSGDSGAALVDPGGRVVGLAFAVAPDDDGVAFALTDEEISAVLAEPRGSPVGTGECV